MNPIVLGLSNTEKLKIFDAFLTATQDYVYLMGRDRRFIFANDAILNLWKKKLKDIQGKSFEELGSPEELVMFDNEQIDTIINTKLPLKGSKSYTDSNGVTKYYKYFVIPVFDSSGNVESVFGSTWDITSKKVAEEELKKYRETLDLALKAGEIGVFVMDLVHEGIPVY